jgi:hypothetical protein
LREVDMEKQSEMKGIVLDREKESLANILDTRKTGKSTMATKFSDWNIKLTNRVGIRKVERMILPNTKEIYGETLAAKMGLMFCFFANMFSIDFAYDLMKDMEEGKCSAAEILDICMSRTVL